MYKAEQKSNVAAVPRVPGRVKTAPGMPSPIERSRVAGQVSVVRSESSHSACGNAALCQLVDRISDLLRCGMMHHVPSPGNRGEGAIRQLFCKLPRLSAGIDHIVL